MLEPSGKLEFSTARLGDAVYDRITVGIVAGALAPGERIRDVDIAEQLGVSRMPVREALQRLEREGLVEMSASRYTRVTAITPELVRAAIEFARCQSGLAARLAVPRMDDDARAGLLARADALRAALGEDDADRTHNIFFEGYLYLVEHTGNPVFRAVARDSRFTLERNFRAGVLSHAASDDLDVLFDAVRTAFDARDGERAEAAVLAVFDAVT